MLVRRGRIFDASRTGLLRFSFSTPKPYDLAVSLIAIGYGVAVLGLFSYYTRVIRAAHRENPV